MNSTNVDTATVLADFNEPRAVRHRYKRRIKDILTRYLMAFGGISVIIAIVLIAFYLFYVVLPMFKPAHLELIKTYPLPGSDAATLSYGMEEQREIGYRLTEAGELIFFRAGSGDVIQQTNLLKGLALELTAFAAGDSVEAILALGLSNGSALLVQHEYDVRYPDDQRQITPKFSFPFGREAHIHYG